jgi:soluble lytic murein transglycosylase-like protein
MKPDDPILVAVVKRWADVYELDPALVMAIVAVESGCEPAAARYEPDYRHLFDPRRVRPPGCSVETEEMLQKTSLGLMQVMGANLREMGYRGWLTEILASMDQQIELGCRYFNRCVKRWGLPDAIAAYNAGSPRLNPDGEYVNFLYVRHVLATAERIRAGGAGATA